MLSQIQILNFAKCTRMRPNRDYPLLTLRALTRIIRIIRASNSNMLRIISADCCNVRPILMTNKNSRKPPSVLINATNGHAMTMMR
jgi:hypothetical protein